eukprot:993834_1
MPLELELAQFWTARVTIQIPLTVIMIILCGIHGYKSFGDYQVKKTLGQEVSRNFTIMSLCTISSIFLYTLSMVLATFRYWAAFNDDCKPLYMIGVFSYLNGKLFMYFVFLIRCR